MDEPSREEIKQAVAYLREGKIIAYPTEAVYGFGCDPFNLNAISDLLQLKQRPIKLGFIIIAADWEHLEQFVQPIEPAALARVLSTWPGPYTWAFPPSPDVPYWLKGDYPTIAVRVTGHPVARALCEEFDGPIVSTSANLSGTPPVRDYQAMKIIFGDQVSMILTGKTGGEPRPTAIRDAISGEIIRE